MRATFFLFGKKKGIYGGQSSRRYDISSQIPLILAEDYPKKGLRRLSIRIEGAYHFDVFSQLSCIEQLEGDVVFGGCRHMGGKLFKIYNMLHERKAAEERSKSL